MRRNDSSTARNFDAMGQCCWRTGIRTATIPLRGSGSRGILTTYWGSTKQTSPSFSSTRSFNLLQKGDEPGEVSLTGEDGRSWELHSTAVKLDDHIGHKVTVTGTVTRESKAEEKKEGQVKNASGKQEY